MDGYVLYTDEDVARIMNVPVNTVRFWRQTKVLGFIKVGKHVRITKEQFETMLKVHSFDTIVTAGDIRRPL